MSSRAGIVHVIVFLAIVLLAVASVGWSVIAASPIASPAQNSSAAATAQQLIKGSDCTSCHSVDEKSIGPSYTDIAKHYKGQDGVVDKLTTKIKQGGSGSWGDIPMTPHSALADEQLKQIVNWILSLDRQAPAETKAAAKLYSYSLSNGTTVQLDFPLFVDGQQPKVTKDIFHGYENFNSYCFRCHGQDAIGSEIAPDLLHSLTTMTQEQFLSVVMVGRPEKGMPTWAGFLSPEEVSQIYEYVKGRSLGLVPVGRPPSAMD
jgi:cytochrome c